jgi:hypothetical protein
MCKHRELVPSARSDVNFSSMSILPVSLFLDSPAQLTVDVIELVEVSHTHLQAGRVTASSVVMCVPFTPSLLRTLRDSVGNRPDQGNLRSSPVWSSLVYRSGLLPTLLREVMEENWVG